MGKMLVITEGIKYIYACPMCLSVVNGEDNYCHQCGQDMNDGPAYSLDELKDLPKVDKNPQQKAK